MPVDRIVKRRIDQIFARNGLPSTICTPQVITTADRNVVDGPYTAGKSVQVMYQASNAAREDANALGLYAERAVHAYFPYSAEGLVNDRCVLKDQKGRYWLVHGEPQLDETDVTFVFYVLATLLKVKPDGVPI